jgi:hypothetical protein
MTDPKREQIMARLWAAVESNVAAERLIADAVEMKRVAILRKDEAEEDEKNALAELFALAGAEQ